MDWYGLTIEEAEEKQKELEEEQEEASIKPLKYRFMADLVKDIKGDKKINSWNPRQFCWFQYTEQ